LSLLALSLCLLAADTARHVEIHTAPNEVLDVVLQGDGPGAPVVLIPGLFGSAYGFRKVVPLLTARGFRTIVVEPLGIGDSGRPIPADYSLTAQADRVAAVLDTLATGPAIVVAHSTGASIAYRLAYRHPELVRSIVSIEGGPAERAAGGGFGRAMRFAPFIQHLGGLELLRYQLYRQLKQASGDTSWITDSVIQGYTAGAAADLGATLRAYRAMAASHEPDSLRPHLADITCPVVLMLGEAHHQGGPQPREVTLLQHDLRSFTVDSVPGAGHYIFEDQPRAVLAAILEAADQAHRSP
jgi:pimeloyl-ACP methyl ester carboxylesterase